MSAFGLKFKDVAASTSLAYIYAPEKAIDNDPRTVFSSTIIDENMKSDYLWLQVELERYSLVERIHITFGQTDDKASKVEVRVGTSRYDPLSSLNEQRKTISKNQICNMYPKVVGKSERIEMVCNKRVFGNYVSVQILDKKARIMKIAEVVVYGKSMSILFIIFSVFFILLSIFFRKQYSSN